MHVSKTWLMILHLIISFNQKKKYIYLQQRINALFCKLTFVAEHISISWLTSLVTVSSLFVTWKVVQTVTTTVADTIMPKCLIFTLYNRY